MGLKADQCIAFEDSENGCLSAAGAGLPIIVTVTDYTRNEPFTGAGLVLSQLGDEGDVAIHSRLRCDFQGHFVAVVTQALGIVGHVQTHIRLALFAL